MCYYSDAYVVVENITSVTGPNASSRRNKKLLFKNNAQFRSSMTKINKTFIGNAEDLDIVMLMYNLLEYSDNHSMTSGSLWNNYRDKVNDDTNENNDAGNYRVNNNKATASKSFENKTEIIGITPGENSGLDAEIVVPWIIWVIFGDISICLWLTVK